MADSKITALTECTDPQLTDIIPIVDDPGGTPATKKVTLTNIKTLVSGMANPMTTAEDIIYGGASGTPTRKAIGTAGQVLGVNSSSALAYLGGIVQITQATPAGGVIDIQSIPAGFQALRLFCHLRCDKSGATQEQTLMRFNNDSAGNYDSQFGSFNGSTSASLYDSAAGSGIIIGNICANNAAAGHFSIFTIDIVNYNNTSYCKSAMSIGHHVFTQSAGNMVNFLCGGTWRTTNAAVNRITILAATGGVNLVAGSVVTLYGLS